MDYITSYLQAKKTSRMNLKYLIPFLFIAFYSCDKKVETKSFEIYGVLSEDFDGYIYLNYGNTLDSVIVKEKKFKFQGKVDNVVNGSLSLKRGVKQADLYIENCSINVKAKFDYREYSDKEKFPHLSIENIDGTNSEKIRKDYYDFYQQNQNKANFQNLLYNKLDTLISSNSGHPFSGGILTGNAIFSPKLSKQQFLNLYAKLDTTKQRETDLSLFKRAMRNLEKYPRGKQFLSFSLPNTKDKMLSYDDKYGNITLIDFWASWCAPCRKTNPKYVELKDRLKNENFDILGISIDDNKDKWLKAIKKDKLEWTNLIDLKQEVYDELDVVGVPVSYTHLTLPTIYSV